MPPASSPTIFISYRRSDSAAVVGRIYDRLTAYYGAASVFLDLDNIPPGADFRVHISQVLENCSVLLAIIGPKWLGPRARNNTRIQHAEDLVRVEIETAFKKNLIIIPVLIDGSSLPRPDALPETLRKLPSLNAVRLDNSRDFHSQVDHLIRFMDGPNRGRSLRRAATSRKSFRSVGMPKVDIHSQPAIAVLPFVNFNGDSETYFSDGITDDVINELASWRLFPVIARSSSFAFRGQAAINLAHIGTQLGARYLVEGGFNKIGERVRISACLIDVATGLQLAAERFDRPVTEISQIQDGIAAMIVASIAPEVLRAERHRVVKTPSKNLSSYEYFLRGLEAHYRYTKPDNEKAHFWFRKSIESDPQNAQALSLLAHAMIHAVQLGWREDHEHNYSMAYELASRAVSIDPRAPLAHFALGSTLMFLRRMEDAFDEIRETIRINPSHAAAHAIMAHLHCYLGRPNDALESGRRALRLSPYDPRLGLWLPALSQAYYFLKNYEEAISIGQKALSLIAENPLALRFTAASLGQIGKMTEAQSIVAVLRRSSIASIEATEKYLINVYRDDQMTENILEGLRKAGLE